MLEKFPLFYEIILSKCFNLSFEQISIFRSGVRFTSFTCEPAHLLPHLYEKLKKIGAQIVRKRIESFEELQSFDLIINCSGLGAKKILMDDAELKPMRGQVIRVAAPWIFEVFLNDADDGNYIIPKYEKNHFFFIFKFLMLSST